MREITSPPNGCWRLSIERTASGWPDSRSSSVATTVVVPRSNAIAWRLRGRVARLDGDQLLVDDHRRDLEVRAAQHAAELAQHLERRRAARGRRSRRAARCDVRALVLERRLLELDVALLHRRAQDHVAPDADERRLGPRLQRRHVDHEVLARGRAAGQPPAGAQLVGPNARGSTVLTGTSPSQHLHLALLARPVAAAGGVDRDAVPARGVEDRRAARHAHLGAVGQEAQPHPLGAVRSGGLRRAVGSARRLRPRPRAHAASAAWRARCAAIQRAPHASWPSSRSAARTGSTQRGCS